jgi:hypothetical protein
MWEKSDSQKVLAEIISVDMNLSFNIPTPNVMANKALFLGEAGMESFIMKALRAQGKKWKALPKYPGEEHMFAKAEEAGLLVRVSGKFQFPDRARIYLATKTRTLFRS